MTQQQTTASSSALEVKQAAQLLADYADVARHAADAVTVKSAAGFGDLLGSAKGYWNQLNPVAQRGLEGAGLGGLLGLGVGGLSTDQDDRRHPLAGLATGAIAGGAMGAGGQMAYDAWRGMHANPHIPRSGPQAMTAAGKPTGAGVGQHYVPPEGVDSPDNLEQRFAAGDTPTTREMKELEQLSGKQQFTGRAVDAAGALQQDPASIAPYAGAAYAPKMMNNLYDLARQRAVSSPSNVYDPEVFRAGLSKVDAKSFGLSPEQIAHLRAASPATLTGAMEHLRTGSVSRPTLRSMPSHEVQPFRATFGGDDRNWGGMSGHNVDDVVRAGMASRLAEAEQAANVKPNSFKARGGFFGPWGRQDEVHFGRGSVGRGGRIGQGASWLLPLLGTLGAYAKNHSGLNPEAQREFEALRGPAGEWSGAFGS